MSATRFTRVTDLPIRDLNVVSRYTTSSDGERLQVRFFTAEAAEPEMRPRLMEMLRAQAGIDAQTGLLDRATIGRLLRSEISRSRRYGNPLSVARYTAGTATVNDSDLVQATMATVAETLKEHLRWTDSVGRSSAQSLLLVLPETDAGAVTILLGKIRAAIGDREGGLTWTTWRRGDNLDSLLSRVAAVESATVVPISKTASRRLSHPALNVVRPISQVNGRLEGFAIRQRHLTVAQHHCPRGPLVFLSTAQCHLPATNRCPGYCCRCRHV